jgi:hypothetical protein
VVPDSGSGELRGEARVFVEPDRHSFTLDYDFE